MLFAKDATVVSGTYASKTYFSFDLDGIDVTSFHVQYSNATTAAKTFGGVREVDQITFAAKASTTNGDYFVINDYLGGSWAVGLDTLGTGAATPTGAAWVAVAAGNKVYTDISSATSGTDVEVLVATAINALTGFTAVITTANSTTHMNCTDVAAGVVTAPTVYSRAGASGTGSITASVTTAGTASNVNTSTNVVTITAHGQVVGSKGQMTTTGALPTGLSTSTDYFIINVSANTVKFASSLANAVAGTAIALTAPGYGTQTFTPTTSTSNVLKAQCSNDPLDFASTTGTSTNWVDVANDTVTISTSTSTAMWVFQRPEYRFLTLVYTPSAGQIALTIIQSAKVDK